MSDHKTNSGENVSDLSAKEAADLRSAGQPTLYDRAMHSSMDGIFIVDASDSSLPIVYVNPAFERITGYSSGEIMGKSWGFLQSETRNPNSDILRQSVASGQEATVVLHSRQKSGELYWNELHIAPVRDSQGSISHYFATMYDITERKSLETERAQLLMEVLDQVDRDPLTGLLNHRAFHKRLADENESASQEQRLMAVVMMNLDNFGFLNDSYGHTTGDEVLREVAELLRKNCSDDDTIARFGGDEFVALLADVRAMTLAEIEARFEGMLKDFNYSPLGHDFPVRLSMCAGAAFLRRANDHIDGLQRADDRMRRKKSGSDEHSHLGHELRDRLSASISGFAMLDSLVTAVDSKDRYTRRHSEDVMAYSLQIADELGLDEKDKKNLATAALLHDVGKSAVPDLILRKPGSLTDEEYETVKQAPMMGAVMVSAVPGMEETLDVIRHHHERWDGLGYPFGLLREETPLPARIMAVAEAISAMTIDRPYRKALSIDDAIKVLKGGSGTQWDPECVDAFVRAQKKASS